MSCAPAGFAYDVLESDHYVPGKERHDVTRFRGKAEWKEIMEVSTAASLAYARRVVGDFDSKLAPGSNAKLKACAHCKVLNKQTGSHLCFLPFPESCAAHHGATPGAHGRLPAMGLGRAQGCWRHGWEFLREDSRHVGSRASLQHIQPASRSILLACPMDIPKTSRTWETPARP